MFVSCFFIFFLSINVFINRKFRLSQHNFEEREQRNDSSAGTNLYATSNATDNIALSERAIQIFDKFTVRLAASSVERRVFGCSQSAICFQPVRRLCRVNAIAEDLLKRVENDERLVKKPPPTPTLGTPDAVRTEGT